MKRSVELYLKDILEYMDRVEEYIQNLDYESFKLDRKTADAVIRCLEVIGEAVKHIPDEIRRKYPSVPWRDIAGMRDRIIHGYFEVDCQQIWLTVMEDIPALKPQIEQILEDL